MKRDISIPNQALMRLVQDTQPAAPKTLRAAKMAIRRTSAAFNMDPDRFRVELTSCGQMSEVQLTYEPQEGQPLTQHRELWMVREATDEVLTEMRKTVDEMVWNMALAFRPSMPAPPTGWSVHPAAAAVIAAAGTQLPNPADPASWLVHGIGELKLPDGGNLVDVSFAGREGVLILRRATIVDNRGDFVATKRTEGHRLMATFAGAYPSSLLDALAGRGAESVCAVFAADPRGAKATIACATNQPGDLPTMVVEMVDRLVPLLPSIPGGERWRPRTAKTVAGPPRHTRYAHLLGHKSSIAARYASRVAAMRDPVI